jgi:hypothetical protein
MRYIFLVAATLAAAVPARAQDQPLTRPSRDVAVEYRSNGMAQGPAAVPGSIVTMRFASNVGRIRIEGSMGHGYAILDTNAGRMTIVMTERRIYMESPADPGMVAIFQAKNGAFRKIGTDTVADVSCTVYEATVNEHSGQLCLTGDGVLLRARGDDGDRNRQLEAVKVTYGEQPPSLFEPPSDYQKMEMPIMPGGMRPGVGGGPGSHGVPPPR